MRKWNAIISAGILILFLVHGVAGAFQMVGVFPGGSAVLKWISWVMMGLMTLHTLIGAKLTRDTILACRKSGASYFKDNKLFWARRISGLAIFVLIFFHVALFMGRNTGVYRLNYFGGAQLVLQILLVLSIAVHVITNVNPLLIAFGMKKVKEYAVDILIVLSVLLMFAGLAFFVYYIRWSRI